MKKIYLLLILIIVGITTLKNPQYLFGHKEIKLIINNKEINLEPKSNIEVQLSKIRIGDKINSKIKENINTMLHITDIYRIIRIDESVVNFAKIDEHNYRKKLFSALDKKTVLELNDWQLVDYFRTKYPEIDIKIIELFKKLSIINSKSYLTFKGVKTIKKLASRF